jgi:hypothetical protein
MDNYIENDEKSYVDLVEVYKEEVMTVQLAAMLANVPEREIYRYCRNWTTFAKKIGGRWIINKRMLRNLIDMGEFDRR